MYNKKKFWFSLIFSWILCNPLFIYADSFFDDNDDEFEKYALGDGPIRTTCNNADQIVPPLDACQVIKIFEENLFLKTNPLNVRSLLDMPLFRLPIPYEEQWNIRAQFFFNRSPRAYFTPDCSNISSYLGFQSPSLITKIENAFQSIRTNECGQFFIDQLGINPSFFNTDVAKILNLFSGITLQEHRAGFMVDLLEKRGLWALGIKIPVYWYEKNFFISQQEQDAIKAAKLFPEESTPDPDAAMEFAQQHLISDLVGLGDMRVILGYEAYKTHDAYMHLGPQVTIPTARAIQRGILGSEFTRCLTFPQFNLCDVLNLNLEASELERRLKKDFDELGKQFVNRLSAILAEEELGNRGHWGIGAFAEPSFTIRDYIFWYNRVSAEYLVPAKETRFFIKRKDPTSFSSRNFEDSDEAVAEDNLRFLNARLIDIFFPTGFDITVKPGAIFDYISSLYLRVNQFEGNVGIDIWGQTKEDFAIGNTNVGTLSPQEFCSKFDVDIAKKPHAFQLKLFGGLAYAFERTGSDLIISFNTDKTVLSSGIGKDFTISLDATLVW